MEEEGAEGRVQTSGDTAEDLLGPRFEETDEAVEKEATEPETPSQTLVTTSEEDEDTGDKASNSPKDTPKPSASETALEQVQNVPEDTVREKRKFTTKELTMTLDKLADILLNMDCSSERGIEATVHQMQGIEAIANEMDTSSDDGSVQSEEILDTSTESFQEHELSAQNTEEISLDIRERIKTTNVVANKRIKGFLKEVKDTAEVRNGSNTETNSATLESGRVGNTPHDIPSQIKASVERITATNEIIRNTIQEIEAMIEKFSAYHDEHVSEGGGTNDEESVPGDTEAEGRQIVPDNKEADDKEILSKDKGANDKETVSEDKGADNKETVSEDTAADEVTISENKAVYKETDSEGKRTDDKEIAHDDMEAKNKDIVSEERENDDEEIFPEDKVDVNETLPSQWKPS
jgi:hypothetical protein